jgi:hypothetical protein
MSNLEFKMQLSGSLEEYKKLLTNYTDYQQYLPHQIKSIKILENSKNYTITEEVLIFNSIKKTFTQKSKHIDLENEEIITEILSGPISGTTMKIILKQDLEKTIVIIKINLKMKIQYKIFSPLINQSYKTFIMAILFKMQNKIMRYE